MEFEEAIKAVKEGKCIQNNDWNRKGMNIRKIRKSTLWNTNSEEMIQTPFLLMETSEGRVFPWTPSQLDIFSFAWEIVG